MTPLAVTISIALGGCGDAESRPVPEGAPDPEHAREVARDPYLVTCADIARQPLHPESQKLVIRAEFALARAPQLREVVYPGRLLAARYLPLRTPSTASRAGSNEGRRPLQISVSA